MSTKQQQQKNALRIGTLHGNQNSLLNKKKRTPGRYKFNRLELFMNCNNCLGDCGIYGNNFILSRWNGIIHHFGSIFTSKKSYDNLHDQLK